MKDNSEDLSARARRQPLSAGDSRALEQALEGSAEARLWHRVGCEFDEEDAVLPGDHDAAERVLNRLMGELSEKSALPQQNVSVTARSRRRIAVLLVAAALLMASVAAATLIGMHWRHAPSQSPTSSGALRASVAPASSLALAPPEPAPEPQVTSLAPAPAAPQAEPSASTSDPSVPPLASAGSASGSSPTPNTASGLLSAAGRARREGYNAQAVTLLEALQARFPNSAEAHASDITLGMLQLKSGAVSAARQHFERYLQRSPQGALAADALWGRAEALAAQGDQAGARASWTALLDRYPDSAYASAARAKLRAH
jgi:TolA-binding protein